MSDLLHAVNAIRDAADGYARAEAYYRGTVGEVFTSRAVARVLGNAGGEFDVNLAKRPVDAVLDRMRIASITVPDDDAATRALVDNVWTPNRMDRYSKLVNRAGLVFGDAYLIVWEGDEDGQVDLFYNSPLTTRVFYDPENPRRKSHAAKVWAEGDGEQAVLRVTLYYPDRVEKWASKAGSRGREEGDFQPHQVDGEPWPVPNPHGQVPVFHFRTSEPYGRPEHEGAFGPQNAITKLINTQMATTDYQGFPQRFALLDGSAGDQLVEWDDDDAEGPTDRISGETGPGTLLKLPGVRTAGQFNPADVDAFLKPLSFYVRMMAASTATPLRFFDPQGQIPSGEALRADEAPLAERITDREDWFGEEWSVALTLAARIAGIPIDDVQVRWRPVQRVSDLTGWQAVKAQLEAGVPAQTALVEAGYQSDVVEGWLAGSDQPSLAGRVELLGRIAEATQKLGASVQLGALQSDQVQAIVAQVLAGLITEPDAA